MIFYFKSHHIIYLSIYFFHTDQFRLCLFFMIELFKILNFHFNEMEKLCFHNFKLKLKVNLDENYCFHRYRRKVVQIAQTLCIFLAKATILETSSSLTVAC